MERFEQLVKALRGKFIAYDVTGNHNSAQLYKDAADAIEELKDKPWVESVQIDKLQQRIDELEEKQTYCDAYGDKWMTSGKDVPTEAYKHGYADGWDEAMAKTEETVCHCNVKENAELIARILDDDVDGKVFELPKRGEWVVRDTSPITFRIECSVCGAERPRNEFDMPYEAAYCPNCGAKMEVQDGQ